MQPFSWRQFAASLAAQPLVVFIGRLVLLVLLLAGIALVYLGGTEAHVFHGLGLNHHIRASSPEAKLITGFGLLTLIYQGLMIRLLLRLRRDQRRERRTDGPPA